MLDKKDLVTIRLAKPEDRNFILATWLRGLYYGDTWFREVKKDTFMKNYHGLLESILNNPANVVAVACLKDDPEVILGYSVCSLDGAKLHWVFCKKAWRSIGIAKSLVPSSISTVTHITKVGLSIMRKRANVEFNPFVL